MSRPESNCVFDAGLHARLPMKGMKSVPKIPPGVWTGMREHRRLASASGV